MKLTDVNLGISAWDSLDTNHRHLETSSFHSTLASETIKYYHLCKRAVHSKLCPIFRYLVSGVCSLFFFSSLHAKIFSLKSNLIKTIIIGTFLDQVLEKGREKLREREREKERERQREIEIETERER